MENLDQQIFNKILNSSDEYDENYASLILELTSLKLGGKFKDFLQDHLFQLLLEKQIEIVDIYKIFSIIGAIQEVQLDEDERQAILQAYHTESPQQQQMKQQDLEKDKFSDNDEANKFSTKDDDEQIKNQSSFQPENRESLDESKESTIIIYKTYLQDDLDFQKEEKKEKEEEEYESDNDEKKNKNSLNIGKIGNFLQFLVNEQSNIEQIQKYLIFQYENCTYSQEEQTIMEEKLIKQCFNLIQQFQKTEYPYEKLTPQLFGSFSMGLSHKDSDIDIIITNEDEDPEYNRQILQQFYSFLVERIPDKQNIKDYTFYKNPLIDYYNTENNKNIDFVIGNKQVYLVTELMKKYLEIHPQVGQLMVLVVRWAKINELIDKQRLSSFFFYNLLIAFLQYYHIIPNLQQIGITEIKDKKEEKDYEYFLFNKKLEQTNTYYEKDIDQIREYMKKNEFKGIERLNLFYLLRKFFQFVEFFIHESNDKFYKISIKYGIYIKAENSERNFQDKALKFQFFLNVYDPFLKNKNLSYRNISKADENYIKQTMLKATQILESINEGQTNIEKFFEQFQA